MDAKMILKCILDVGEAMLRYGAETFRVEDSMYRMCRAYGFKRTDVFVIPSNIQATVQTVDNDIFTQVRYVDKNGIDFDKLDYLNNLSRYVCANRPDVAEFEERFEGVMKRKDPRWYVKYLAGAMGGTGFTVFFGGDKADAFVAFLLSLLIISAGEWLSTKESGLVVYNLTLSFLGEMMVLLLYLMGFGTHPERIMIGIVMLLISGIGTTNGIRNLMNKDILAGIINITNSVLGAGAIASGIALAMLLMKGVM